MLRPAVHPPQQNAVMVDIHDQVRDLELKQEDVEDFFFFLQMFKIPLVSRLVGSGSHITLNPV